MLRRLALVVLIVLSAAATQGAQAAGLLEKNFWLNGPRYDAKLPACSDPAALAKIAARFQRKEGHFWNSELRIDDFLSVREIAFRPWAVDTIPRRFCSGHVLVSDGKKRRINFSIIEDGGMIGASWGVEWCVVGLDRNSAFSPGCKMAQP